MIYFVSKIYLLSNYIFDRNINGVNIYLNIYIIYILSFMQNTKYISITEQIILYFIS